MTGIISETALAAQANSGVAGVHIGSTSSGYRSRIRRSVSRPVEDTISHRPLPEDVEWELGAVLADVLPGRYPTMWSGPVPWSSMALTPRSSRGRSTSGLVAAVIAVGLLAGACSGEEATPIDPANPPTTAVDLTDITHQIEPTEQMEELAEQQCLDDATLTEGYVRAVDPDTEAILSEVTVDCDEVRARG